MRRLVRLFAIKVICLFCIFIQIASVFFMQNIFVYAEQETQNNTEKELMESVEDLISQMDLRALQEYLDGLDFYQGETVAQRLVEYIKGDSFDYQSFWDNLWNVLFENVKKLLPAFATITAIALLCGLLSMLKSGSSAKTTGEMLFLICYAAALIPLVATLSECFEMVAQSIGVMQKQMQIIYPLLLTLMAASGGGVSVAACRPAVAFFSNGMVSLMSGVVLPLTVAIVAFSIASNMTKELKISKFTAFFKSINKWIIGICVSVFGLFFTLQGITSSVYDGVVRRAAKYAIGNGIPIVGGFLSGGFDLAVAGGILIKNSLGGLGIFLMVSVVYEPLVLLICTNVLLRFTAAITQPFGDSRISNFLGETADNLGYCTAAILFTAFMYFLTIVLMVLSSESLL